FVITAHGCTHHCSFCAIPPTTGGKYLLHNSESVLRDIKLLGDIPFIRMVDANTFGNPRAAQELCDRIKAAGIRKKYIADVRADTIVNHYDLLKEWQGAGLAGVVVGFEEVEDSRLSAYDKQYKSDVVTRSLEMLHKLGLMIVGDFIVSPDYTEDDFARLEKFIARHKIHVPMLSILTPLPGTPLYASAKNNLLIHDLDYYTFTNAVLPTRLPQRQFYETYASIMNKFHSR
ncbi:MAG TPA: radical SAM protein, partial [Smithellaceae bacterium]|nr:radical SAM protein [Smithellaceae bacterium]